MTTEGFTAQQPISNFSDFYSDNFLTDCVLEVHDGNDESKVTNIYAHKLILANSSDFFYNAFTSGMMESIAHENAEDNKVAINDNPENLFPSVVKWIYDGKIDFTLDNFVSIYHIAYKYGIPKLEEELKTFLDHKIDKDTILPLVAKCYTLQLQQELHFFEKYLVKFFEEIPLSKLSEDLDVATFARVIQQKSYDVETLIDRITEFLGNWDPTPEERDALLSILGPISRNLKQLVKSKNVTWLPQGFLKTC